MLMEFSTGVQVGHTLPSSECYKLLKSNFGLASHYSDLVAVHVQRGQVFRNVDPKSQVIVNDHIGGTRHGVVTAAPTAPKHHLYVLYD